MFDPALHTLAAYQQAAASFVEQQGFTPYCAVCSPEGLPAHVLARAQLLDTWDVWLFSSEAQPSIHSTTLRRFQSVALHNYSTTVTPQEVSCLHNALSYVQAVLRAKREAGEKPTDGEWLVEIEAKTAARWLANVKEGLYSEWAALPEGSHLKEAYADEVWTWSDRDLAAGREADNLPGSDAVDLQGFRRPKPEELADG